MLQLQRCSTGYTADICILDTEQQQIVINNKNNKKKKSQRIDWNFFQAWFWLFFHTLWELKIKTLERVEKLWVRKKNLKETGT